MIGIYKIENLENGNIYVGLSSNISQRWLNHRSTAFNKNSSEYQYPLYRAIRKYGIDKFSFEVLEEINTRDLSILQEREVFWIAHFNSHKKGYNQTPGGDAFSQNRDGENHHNHKLTEEDVIDIRQRWAACKESSRDIYIDYANKIGKSGFKKIYSWQTWKKILPELFTDENRKFHRENTMANYSNAGSKNGRTKLNEEMVLDIRIKKRDGYTLDQVWEEYQDIGMTKGSFMHIWYGYNWKSVVVV